MASSVTIVDGETLVNLIASDGSFNVVDATLLTDHPVGVYNRCGAMNVTFLADDETAVPLYAPNGSVNVIENSSDKYYNRCGAMNVVVVE